MKKILTALLLILVHVSESSVAPRAFDDKIQTVSVVTLDSHLRDIITFHYPSVNAPQNPSFAFYTKEEAIAAGWQFKQQPFNRGEIVITPTDFLGANPNYTARSSEPLLKMQDMYMYSLYLGMCENQAVIQKFIKYNNGRKPTLLCEKKLFPIHDVGKLPKNDI